MPDPSGALLWPERDLLIVADLHLEKGSAFAARGRFLPPYDTRATLDELKTVLTRVRPKTVICLGDSFHDTRSAGRMDHRDAETIRSLSTAFEWIWVTGNHDPEPCRSWGGQTTDTVAIGALSFRHEALPGESGEVSGHYHPKAAVRIRSRRISSRCFVSDGRRIILPAFGAFTGGLNVLDPAVSDLFPMGFQADLIWRDRIHRFTKERLEPDRPAVRSTGG